MINKKVLDHIGIKSLVVIFILLLVAMIAAFGVNIANAQDVPRTEELQQLGNGLVLSLVDYRFDRCFYVSNEAGMFEEQCVGDFETFDVSEPAAIPFGNIAVYKMRVERGFFSGGGLDCRIAASSLHIIFECNTFT